MGYTGISAQNDYTGIKFGCNSIYNSVAVHMNMKMLEGSVSKIENQLKRVVGFHASKNKEILEMFVQYIIIYICLCESEQYLIDDHDIFVDFISN